MSADEANSAGPSGRTPPSGPPTGPTPGSDPSEPAFLEQEAEQAKAAVVRTLHDLQHDLASAADLRTWTQQHPWLAVGVAVLAGFAAAAAIPGGAEPADRSSEEPRESGPSEAPHPHASPFSGSLDWLAKPLSGLLSTAVEKFVAAWRQSASSPGPSKPEAGESESPKD